MNDMADMLTGVATNLQQSFETVFQRVGDSLSKSSHVMQMMNEMMEAALLQSLIVHYKIARQDPENTMLVSIEIENRSQISLKDALVRIKLFNEREDLLEKQLIGLEANSRRTERFSDVEFAYGYIGIIELLIQSPGTQQLLRKEFPLRVSMLQAGIVDSIASSIPEPTNESSVDVDNVSLTALRLNLGINPFDQVLTEEKGYYHFVLPKTSLSPELVFYILVHASSLSPTVAHVHVISSVHNTSHVDQSTRLMYCEQLIEAIQHHHQA